MIKSGDQRRNGCSDGTTAATNPALSEAEGGSGPAEPAPCAALRYRFLEDAPTADVGFLASGKTLEECFTAAADATLAVMLANPASLRPTTQLRLHVDSDALDLALLKFLEELIYYKDTQSLFLRVRDVRVRQTAEQWSVEAVAEGETIDPTRHQLSADVKAVTLHRLTVQQTDGGWEATVVLDI